MATMAVALDRNLFLAYYSSYLGPLWDFRDKDMQFKGV